MSNIIQIKHMWYSLTFSWETFCFSIILQLKLLMFFVVSFITKELQLWVLLLLFSWMGGCLSWFFGSFFSLSLFDSLLGQKLHIPCPHCLKEFFSEYLKWFLKGSLLAYVSFRKGMSNHMRLVVNNSLIDHLYWSITKLIDCDIQHSFLNLVIRHLYLFFGKYLIELSVVAVVKQKLAYRNQFLYL